jgi:chromosomal replication initiation ATPase DnaA
MHIPIIRELKADARTQEIVSAIIKATCTYYGISEEDLINTDRRRDAVNRRRLPMYLIMKNTDLTDNAAAERFGVTRSPFKASVDLIEYQVERKTIYRQTEDTLNAIAAIANNFEKKYAWHIH